jgi:acetyl-CoA synthetase
MQPKILRKSLRDWVVAPNLKEYPVNDAAFTWAAVRAELTGSLAGQGLNIAHEAVDRHAAGPLPDRLAIRCVLPAGDFEEWTYSQLAVRSNQFAHWLIAHSVSPRDRVATLLGARAEFAIAALGALKVRAIFCPLSRNLTLDQLQYCLRESQPKVLVTTSDRWELLRDYLGSTRFGPAHVLIVPEPHSTPIADTTEFSQSLASASKRFGIPPTQPDEPALLHWQPNEDGSLRGVIHAHRTVIMHYIMGRFAFDLHPSDRFFSTLDLADAVGFASRFLAPLTNGITTLWADMAMHLIPDFVHHQDITVWQTDPSCLWGLREHSLVSQPGRSSALRFVTTTGGRLDPQLIEWSCSAFGLPVHDQWSQPETGGILIGNVAAADIRIGSMGRPLPGVRPHVLADDPSGPPPPIKKKHATGKLAFEIGWPGQFSGYWNSQSLSENVTSQAYFVTGETITRDSDGYFWPPSTCAP